ncbi:MAG: ankyrin repeat domain-containing protein [Verrucomicrobia bacterium]|nr:ankyrin repeat domain-containing protein [Verrucomicrobiota bacterium]
MQEIKRDESPKWIELGNGWTASVIPVEQAESLELGRKPGVDWQWSPSAGTAEGKFVVITIDTKNNGQDEPLTISDNSTFLTDNEGNKYYMKGGFDDEGYVPAMASVEIHQSSENRIVFDVPEEKVEFEFQINPESEPVKIRIEPINETVENRHEDSAPAQSGAGESPAPQDQGSNIQARNALLQSALSGNIDQVASVLDNIEDIDSAGSDERTALMLAAFNGHTDIVNLLLGKGADVNAVDAAGRTALMYAATGEFPKTVKLLLDNGASVNLQDKEEHFTALMFAAAEGNDEVIKILLENDADPAIKDLDGDTALSFAEQNAHTSTVRILQQKMK